ncbi:PBP1A family penicillin-binding protein [Desulfobotulus sp.]|jgi:penicillin-binding protein 1A|uniref:penicillin-binding protein 1A n=1 Tax=Desulfobotulus sp. TaxID=1940337 RepID=UPI002A370B3B|nr:PBP1A family penicillin-binding protein [Desulfobotulus sp.]MDY0162125.1 PBP1A family penicillin-binding protein [Desulfobotulus sp.]
MIAIPQNPTPQAPPKAPRRFILWGFLILFFLFLMIVAGSGGAYFYFSRDLPSVSTLKAYRPPTISTVYAADGTIVAEFFRERRIVIPLKDMPEQLIQAFLAAEDARFFQHKGIDPMGILRAFIKNVQASGIVQGGSTITQQVAKSFFLSPERSYTRKIREAILAYRIERYLEKEEILHLYLNQIFLGHGAYGVEAAAQNYFGLSSKNLSLAQCAMLAGLPQAPSRYSPFRHPERARERQLYVLSRMVSSGVISAEAAEKARNETLEIYPRQNIYMEMAPYYTEHIRQYVLNRYGEKALYEEGLHIRTALDLSMQRAAENALQKGLLDLDKRQGFRGALRNVGLSGIEAAIAESPPTPSPAPDIITHGFVVNVDNAGAKTRVRFGRHTGEIPLDTMRWARRPNPDIPHYNARIQNPSQALRVGDEILVRLIRQNEDGIWELRLEQTPKAQSALLCMEAETGKVRAMMGGRDFRSSQFNRAIQSRRQAGSAFKPFIYAAALDKGYTPASVIVDNAFVFRDRQRDFTWKPKNYQDTFYGPTLLREALAKSRNVITIKILEDIGIDYTLGYVRKLGLTSPINRDLSIALGSSGHSLLEIVNAYGIFAHQGQLFEPVFVTEIRDRDGRLLEKNTPFHEKVVSEETAFLMTSLLESVVSNGTGWRAKSLTAKGWPVAAKTGTTNNLNDAWFVGYTPAYVTGVWVGFDEEGPLGDGETGSRAAAPIWVDFMEAIHAGLKPRPFAPPPPGIVTVRIDTQTGLLPIPESEATAFEYFHKGHEPTAFSPRSGEIENEKDFFKQGL